MANKKQAIRTSTRSSLGRLFSTLPSASLPNLRYPNRPTRKYYKIIQGKSSGDGGERLGEKEYHDKTHREGPVGEPVAIESTRGFQLGKDGQNCHMRRKAKAAECQGPEGIEREVDSGDIKAGPAVEASRKINTGSLGKNPLDTARKTPGPRRLHHELNRVVDNDAGKEEEEDGGDHAGVLEGRHRREEAEGKDKDERDTKDHDRAPTGADDSIRQDAGKITKEDLVGHDGTKVKENREDVNGHRELPPKGLLGNLVVRGDVRVIGGLNKEVGGEGVDEEEEDQ